MPLDPWYCCLWPTGRSAWGMLSGSPAILILILSTQSLPSPGLVSIQKQLDRCVSRRISEQESSVWEVQLPPPQLWWLSLLRLRWFLLSQRPYSFPWKKCFSSNVHLLFSYQTHPNHYGEEAQVCLCGILKTPREVITDSKRKTRLIKEVISF